MRIPKASLTLFVLVLLGIPARAQIDLHDLGQYPIRIQTRNGVNNGTDAANTDLVFSSNCFWVDGTGYHRDVDAPASFFQFENNWPTGVGNQRLNEINWTTVDASGAAMRFLNFIHRTDDINIGLATFQFPIAVNIPPNVNRAASLGGTDFEVASYPGPGDRTSLAIQNNSTSSKGSQFQLNSGDGAVNWLFGTDRFFNGTNNFFIWDQVARKERIFIGPTGGVTIGGNADYGAGNLAVAGDIISTTVGKGLELKGGTNQRAGNATLNNGSVTVSNTTVTANTLVHLTRKSVSGNAGEVITYTLSPGSGFTINSNSSADKGTFTYLLTELN